MTVSREETQRKLDLLASGVTQHVPEQAYTVPDRFEACARECPDKVFLVYADLELTFAEINRQANRYAQVALGFGIEPGDVGAVMIENRPEFFYAWLGLSKIGAIAALINTQARGKALSHAIEETGSKILFLGGECEARFATVEGLADKVKTLYVADGEFETVKPRGLESVGDYLLSVSVENPDQTLRANVVGETPVFYVFTSGTTGLPKAAVISHMRWLGVGDGWASVLGMTDEDVFYCILPLFHGAAGMSLVSNALASRASIVICRQFSASKFWPDVRQYGVTIVQYVGEICRYLINQPPQANDKDHSLKRMTGAGMTAEVWKSFVERFGDIEIYEGWGATEANCSMMNLDGLPGACGRIPFKELSNARLVKYDVQNDVHITCEDGFLVECEPGEVGELLGMVLDIPGVGAGRFEGYISAEATEKKILRNVFAEGDAWFRSGDLFTQDGEGYFYFSDRIGDTYRWKSENVSTTEVTEALEGYAPAEMINVYGVLVPGQEGRAGMIALELKQGASFDPVSLYRQAVGSLPAYAVPLFVRVRPQSDLTVTFKLRKVDLQKAGYNPDNFSDPLFVLDRELGSYVPYTRAALDSLGVAPF
ncbi:MAG: long-chain-acyl-CoA synthetase [Halioglobus sp.]